MGVDGLTIRGNSIEQAGRRASRESGRYAIRVLNSARVAAEGNHIDPARQGRGFSAAERVTGP